MSSCQGPSATEHDRCGAGASKWNRSAHARADAVTVQPVAAEAWTVGDTPGPLVRDGVHTTALMRSPLRSRSVLTSSLPPRTARPSELSDRGARDAPLAGEH